MPSVVAIHTFLMGRPPTGLEIDHIDRNGLNNRRGNLRFVTHAENMQNRTIPTGQTTTGIPGVHRDKKGYRVEVYARGGRVRKNCRTIDEALVLRAVLRAQLGVG